MANFLKLQGRYVRKLLNQLRREYAKRPGALEIREVYKDMAVPDDLDASPDEVDAYDHEGLPHDCEESAEASEANDLEDMDDEYSSSRDGSDRPARPSSIPAYHLAIREVHLDLVQRLLPPELGKPVLGTLSVIATRQPILQSEIIQIRGKRAYAHIKDLLVHRLILRRPQEGTYRLQTTQEFQRRYRIDASASQRTRSLRGRSESASEVEEPDLSEDGAPIAPSSMADFPSPDREAAA
jgi:chromosome segregation and condensation protein ScpB